MKDLRISKRLFLETSGLNDSRNKNKDIGSVIDGHFDADGCIWYHRACILVKDLWIGGTFWMWPPETFPKRLLDHIDDWIGAGLISFDYK